MSTTISNVSLLRFHHPRLLQWSCIISLVYKFTASNYHFLLSKSHVQYLAELKTIPWLKPIQLHIIHKKDGILNKEYGFKYDVKFQKVKVTGSQNKQVRSSAVTREGNEKRKMKWK